VVSPGPPVSHPEPGRTARLAMVWVPAMESIVGRVGLTQGLDQVLALVAGRALVPAMGLGLDPVMGPVTDPGSVLRTGRGLADRQQAPSALLHQPTTRLNKSAPHSRFFPSTKRGVPHISLVFREMWDTANLNLFSVLRKNYVECCGIPYLAKNERDMGHPTLCGREKAESVLALLEVR
jgi:hypothetical protein